MIRSYSDIDGLNEKRSVMCEEDLTWLIVNGMEGGKKAFVSCSGLQVG
jgi:hypothetical protein